MAQLEMLRYLHDHDLVRISDRQPENWEEAIRISCENLIDKGIINSPFPCGSVRATWV